MRLALLTFNITERAAGQGAESSPLGNLEAPGPPAHIGAGRTALVGIPFFQPSEVGKCGALLVCIRERTFALRRFSR